MKILNINIRLLAQLAVILLIIVTSSCKQEETYGPFDNVSIDVLIAEAESLVANSSDGILPGDYKPGSVKELQDVLTWAKWKKENSKDQSEIATAANRLSIYIEKFKANIVTYALPWIQRVDKTMIVLSDNTSGAGVSGRLKEITKKPFTVELKLYAIDLNELGYSNNVFANVMGKGGDNGDRGCEIRYFSDGVVHMNIAGGGKSWQTTASDPGLMTAGKWIHMTYVNNITNHKLYLDGAEVLSSDAIYEDSDDDFPFVIGNTFPWQDRTINALVQDFRIWTEARTAAQINETLDAVNGDEANLEVYFPFSADLGKSFSDFSGKFKAEFVKDVVWAPDGIIVGIEADVSALNGVIKSVNNLISEVVEGSNNGDYPFGTKDYLQSLIDEANNLLASDPKQSQVDDMVDNINSKVELVKSNLVVDAYGIYINREDSKAVGLRITPNYTPQGDYTVEFDLKIKTLLMSGNGEIFGNGAFGLMLSGYKELTEAQVLQSGGIWNFNAVAGGWDGPESKPATIVPEKWQHIAIVHDNTARTTVIYVDGEIVAEMSNIDAPIADGQWGEIWLGNSWGKINGSIKDFRIWDEVKASGELDAEITGSETNLRMYFPLNRVAGIKFNDATGNDYEAELRGVTWRLIE